MTNQNNLPPGAFYDSDHRLMIPIIDIVENPDNPRDKLETDYRDPEFRGLVENIIITDGMNHTPIQVYFQEGKYQLIAGHRRLNAVIKASELRQSEWERTKSGDEPLEVTHIYASLMSTPRDEFQKRQMMFSAEETSKKWGDVRKFNFFKDMVAELPQTVRGNPVDLFERMREATGLPPSTVKTYCSFIRNKELADAMGEPEVIRFPRTGRMKMIRACDRGVNNLVSDNPSLVRQLTLTKDATSQEAKRKLGRMFLKKLEAYKRLRANGDLAVGPGVAMERTVAEIKSPTDGPIEDVDIAKWLDDEKQIFRKEVIHQTKRKDDVSASRAYAHVLEWKIPKITGTFSDVELQAMADDFAECGDYFDKQARKIRDALRKRNDG